MTIYYLYLKTHNITGLKYLGQTKQDPFIYKGSGKEWRAHLKLFGNLVSTEILLSTDNTSGKTQKCSFLTNFQNK